MPNKSKINRELVKMFNSVLLSDNTAITNLTIEKDHVVLSFDKDMNIGQRREYLSNMGKNILRKFCGEVNKAAAKDPDEDPAKDPANYLFYTDYFPFNFNQGKWITDNSRHRFSVPIEKEVVYNLKYLLANELTRFTIESIIGSHPDKNVEGIFDKEFERESYVYCISFYDRELKNSFVSLFSSRMESYENSPKRFKDFLKQQYCPEYKEHHVYLKKGVFDDLKFVKDIVKHRASLICRCFDTPKGEIEVTDMLKFALVDLFCKANIPVVRMIRASYSDSDEDSVLIPTVSDSGDYLTKEEAEQVNNIFGMVILNNVEGHISQENVEGHVSQENVEGHVSQENVEGHVSQENVEGHVSQKSKSKKQGIYAIDCANQDIAYCLLNKIKESSLISEYKAKNQETGKDEIKYKLSIDPACVPAMKPQTLAPNASKFLSDNYYGEDKGGDDASAKDSGFGASSARSSFNDKPRPILDQPSVLQSEQCSTKKHTSVGKNTSCCIL